MRTESGRDLAWWQFLLLVLVYLAIIQVGGRVIGADVGADENWETAGNLLRTALIPVALSAVFVIGIATWLGWWPQIIHEPLRTQRWVRIVPVALLLAAAVGASWGNLVEQQADLVLALVVLVCLVGFTEELMFRGVGLVTFRRMHLTEAKVALYSSVVFGAAHLSNALGTGTNAIVQAIIVSLTGYMLYLTRRWAGTIWLAMPVHGSQDFLIASGQIGIDPDPSPLSLVLLPTMIGLAILLWRRRRRVDPEALPAHRAGARRRAVTTAHHGARCQQRIDDLRGGRIERPGQPCQHDSAHLLRFAADGDGLDVGGEDVEGDRGERGDGQAGGDDLELGEPVAYDVADLGAFGQARPYAEERLGLVGPRRHPDLSLELLDLHRAQAGERVVGGDADDQLALGQRGEVERGSFGVRRPVGRIAGEHREVERARAKGPGERGRGALAQRHRELRRQRRERSRHEPRGRGGEGAEPHRAGRGRLAGRLSQSGVELVQDAAGPGEEPCSRRRQRDTRAGCVRTAGRRRRPRVTRPAGRPPTACSPGSARQP